MGEDITPTLISGISKQNGTTQDKLNVITPKEQVENFVAAVNLDAKHQQDLIQSDLGIARTLASGTHASGSHLTKTLITKGAIGVDVYNQELTGDISASLTAATGGTNTSGGKVMVLNDQGGAVMNTSENIAGALRAQEHGHQPIVYGISAYESNSMKSPNPHSGIYEADTTRTLDNNGGNPACNQGGMIVLEGNGSRPSHKGDGYAESEVSYTLNAVEQHAVAYRKTGHPQNADEGQGWEETDLNDTLNAFDNGETRTPTVILENHPADSRLKICEDGIFQTLSSRMGTGGGNVPMVMENAVCIGNGQTAQTRISDKVGALNCMHDQQAVMQGISGDVAGTLDASYYKGCEERQGVEREVIASSVVRRLTPLECERLQGFPDHWTDIGEWVDSKGKTHKDADSPRYKAIGNSIALPFWEWMAKRMVEKLKVEGVEEPTMASLFDGIGGFPLVYQRAGCKPVWASEVESFCIAVTKRRFPDG